VGRRLAVTTTALVALITAMLPITGATATPRRWKVVATPDLGADSSLASVACADETTCFAVGSVEDRKMRSSVIERWDGKHWAVLESPHPPNDQLFGVACGSSTSCVAVGRFQPDASVPMTFVVRWRGTTWKQVPSPAPQFGAQLRSVSCANATVCVAVGDDDDMHGYVHSFAAVEDGNAWNASFPPDEGIVGDNSLASVSCPAVSRCVAVGDWADPEHPSAAPHIVAWNGAQWGLQTPDNPNARSRTLASVSCPTLRRCTAVGVRGRHPLAETAVGATWSIQSTPETGARLTTLSGVACPRVDRCVIAGSVGPNRNHERPLIELGGGSSWTIVQDDLRVGTGAVIGGVACASVDLCFAVGRSTVLQRSSTLVVSGPS
jgi:hypothetical protein